MKWECTTRVESVTLQGGKSSLTKDHSSLQFGYSRLNVR